MEQHLKRQPGGCEAGTNYKTKLYTSIIIAVPNDSCEDVRAVNSSWIVLFGDS
jgi:hypothetical protein